MEPHDDRNQDDRDLFIGEDNVDAAPPPSPWSADEPDAQASSQTATVEEEQATACLPLQPRTLPDTGLSKAFLMDLALKTIHYTGVPSVANMTQRMAVSPAIVQDLLTLLTEEHLCGNGQSERGPGEVSIRWAGTSDYRSVHRGDGTPAGREAAAIAAEHRGRPVGDGAGFGG